MRNDSNALRSYTQFGSARIAYVPTQHEALKTDELS